jgi:hypothetical protein
MTGDDALMRDACRVAAADLGVRIVTPFSVAGEDGAPVEFIALFPDFGGAKGTAVCHFRDWPAKHVIAAANGYYCSGLHPDSYSRYDREQFVDAFTEWGWLHGTSSPPAWYREALT